MVNDRLRLITKSYLAAYHEQIVDLLYQPIIGQRPVSLYRTLWSLINIEKGELTLSHRQLLTFFNVTIEEFEQIRNKLEAIDLLHVYYQPQDGYYVYEIRQPLTAKQFFLDSNLNIHLIYAVGHNLYDYLENKFLNRDCPKGIINLTKSFEDVYQSLKATPFMDDDKAYITNNVTHLEVPIHYEFDYELFTAFLNKSFVEPINEAIKNQIIKEAALFEFDAQLMSKVVLDCVKDGKIEVNDLHQTASQYYKRLKTKPKSSKKIKASMSEEAFFKADIDELKKKALFNYKTKTPHEWLRILQNHTEVPGSYLEVVRVLFEEYKLPSEVINVLIEFVRTRNDGRLPLEYTKAIASSWTFKKIKLAEQAIEEIEKIEQVEQNYTKQGQVAPTYRSRKPKYVASEPKWLEEHEQYRKSVKEEAEEVNIDDLKKLLEACK